MELAWRDFYTSILASFPRVSMGRPFNEKYAGVKWEVDEGGIEEVAGGEDGSADCGCCVRQMNTMGRVEGRRCVLRCLNCDCRLDA